MTERRVPPQTSLKLVPMCSDEALLVFPPHRLPLPYSLHSIGSSHPNDWMFSLWGRRARKESFDSRLILCPFQGHSSSPALRMISSLFYSSRYFSRIVSRISRYFTFSNSCKMLAFCLRFWVRRHEKI